MGVIKVEFDDKNKASFEIKTDSDEQIFTALLGIEAYLAAKTSLHVNDIREIMDDMKKDLTVKEKE